MTPITKDTRRADWKKLNFAGTIDWAVDLQAFGSEDMDAQIKLPATGSQGCVSGESNDYNADHLCRFACTYGFCPEPTCFCRVTGSVEALPPVASTGEFLAWDPFAVDLQRLCKFSCKYGFCPPDTCGVPDPDEYEDGSTGPGSGGLFDKGPQWGQNAHQCQIFKSGVRRDSSALQCRDTCFTSIEAAKKAGRTTNYGCAGWWPPNEEIPWVQYPGTHDEDSVYATGHCVCDDMMVNLLADTVIEALPKIAAVCVSGTFQPRIACMEMRF